MNVSRSEAYNRILGIYGNRYVIINYVIINVHVLLDNLSLKQTEKSTD